MHPMPAKNRSAVMIGAALLAVVIGVAAVWLSRNGAEPQPQQLDQLQLDPIDAAETAPTGSATAQPTQADSATAEQPLLSAPTGFIPVEHVVLDHETLSSISMQYYGDIKYAGDIEHLNQLDHPHNIKAGDRLKLPRREDLPALGQ